MLDSVAWAIEQASYLVTVVGLPFAIWVFLSQQRKERENEEEEAYLLLSSAYNDFLKLVLANPDLKLRTESLTPDLNDEQRERRLVIFEMLIALFERAYLLLYEPDMSGRQARRWNSWEDYMREWCRREDFRALLPRLLQGEDAEFAQFIRGLAGREAGEGSSANLRTAP
jgi:hypothetical protein